MPYLISDRTLALIPSSKKTKVLEQDITRTLYEEAHEIVSRSCQVNGSTLEGRQKGSSFLIGSSYKPPIIISDQENIIMIPTHSVRNKNCMWISLNNLLNYYPYCNDRVAIEFRNHQKLILNISYGVFDRQVLRATRLESALRGRNNKKHL